MCTKNHCLFIVLFTLAIGLMCWMNTLSAVAPFGSNDFSTTYVGNSFRGSDTEGENFIQQRIVGFYTHADGTSFGTCRWEEGHRNVGIYDTNGNPAGLGHDMFGRGGFGVAASQSYIFALGREDMGSSNFGVWRLQRNGTRDFFRQVRTGSGWDEPHLRGIAIDENAVGGVRDNVYVSNHHENYVRAYDYGLNTQRDLSITDPWAVAVASDGHLWVVQPSLNRAAKFNALNGAYMSAQITGLIDPGPIGIDNSNNVWVFDRDPSRHQFLIFSQSGGDAATPSDTFGVAGGVWAASTAGQTGTATVPGEVHPLKFNHATGIAFDSSNNIYVGGDGVPIEGNGEGSGAWMRKFNSSRASVWEKYGLEFLDVSDADRSTDAVHLYTKHEHFVMDWNQPQGQEQTYKGYTLDPFAYPLDWRKWYGWKTIEDLDPANWEYRITGQFDAMVRVLPDSEGNMHRFLYVGDQDASGRAIYRFEEGSEIAIPCATIRKDYPVEAYQYEDPPGSGTMHWGFVGQWYSWRDENGDGQGDGKINQIDPAEVEFSEGRGGVWGWWVDQNGNIWTGDKDGRICEYKYMGVNSIGAPIYPLRPTREWVAPDDFDPNGATRGEVVRVVYLEETDTLYIGGYPVNKPAASGDWGGLGREIIRYDNWTSENTTKRYAIDDLVYDYTGDAGTSTIVKSMDMVGDIVVYGYVHDYALNGYNHDIKKGRLEVYNHLTKQKLGTLLPNSGVGYKSWIETPRSFNAYLRDDGEYQIYVTDEAQAKVVIYRLDMWAKPASPAAPSGLTAVAYRDMQANLSWTDNSSDENGFIIEASTDGGSTFKFIQGCGQNVTSRKVRGLTPATTYIFRICATNSGGNSAYVTAGAITTGAALEQLTGTPFGEGIPYGEPPDPDAPNGYKAAYDGDLNTYVDFIDDWANDGYAGLDLGASTQVWRARFLQRIKRPDRLIGGKFQGSTDGVIYTDLHTITKANLTPVDGWNYVDFDPVPTYRYIRYYSAPNGMCNVSEIEYYSEPIEILPPDAPENLAVSTVSDTELQVTWTDMSTQETGFRVERTTDGASFIVGQNVASYNDPDLAPSTTYTYRVVAFNSLFETPCESPTTASGTTDAPSPPAPPTNLVCTPADGRIYLDWTASTDPDTLYYKVYRSTTQGSGHICVAIAFGGLNIIDSQVVNDTTYYYYVTAVDFYGLESSTTSNEDSATPHVLDTPDAPSDLSATAAAYNQVDLSWVDNADNEDGFKVERKTTGAFSLLVDLPTPDLNATIDLSVDPDTTYTYRVIAYNGDGDSAPSNEDSATTPTAPIPDPPSNLTATADTEGNWIVLQWQDNSDVEDGFKIERKTTGAYTEVATVGEDVVQRTDAGLDWDTTYTYRVRAYNTSGDSAYSNEDSDTTPTGSTGPVVVDDADASITYSGTWTAQSGWAGRINETVHETNQNGAYCELTFSGTAIKLYADMQTWGGTADVYIDSVLDSSISFQSTVPDQYQQVVYDKTGLVSGSHTIRVQKSGGDWIYIDAFEYQGGGTPSLPPPWASADVGPVGIAGSAIATGGDSFTVNGSGYDIWYAYDAFHYVYQTSTGDAEIIARIDSMTNTDDWAKAGVMIRESLNQDAEYAMIGLTPANGSQMIYRDTTAGSSNTAGSLAGTAPEWYKLTRTGNTVTGSISENGTSWTQIGTWTFTDLSSSAYIGLAVCSHDDLALCEGQFTNVSVSP